MEISVFRLIMALLGDKLAVPCPGRVGRVPGRGEQKPGLSDHAQGGPRAGIGLDDRD